MHHSLKSASRYFMYLAVVAMVAASSVPPASSGSDVQLPSLQPRQTVSAVTRSKAVTLSSWSPASGDLVLVSVGHETWRSLVPQVSGNNLSFERVAEVRNAQDVNTITLFRAQGAAVPGSISVTLPGNSGPATVIAMSVVGVPVGHNGSSAIAAVSTEDGPSADEGDNANMRTDVQASSGDLVLGFGTNSRRMFAVPSGETAGAVNVAVGKAGSRVSSSAWYETVGAASPVTIGANGDLVGGNGADDWAMVGIAVRSALAGNTTTTTAPGDTTTTQPMATTPLMTTTTTAPATTTTTADLTVPPAPVPPASDPRPYDAASPWNTPIPATATVDPLSDTYIRAISDNNLPLTSDVDQYTVPVYRFDASTPLQTIKMSGYFSTYDNGDNSRVGHGFAPTVTGIPVPAGAQQSSGTDGQIVLWNADTGVEYSFWQFRQDASGAYFATNGYRYHTTAGYNGRFADGLAGRGAGTPYLAGLVRKWEIDRGQIDHAVAFAYQAPSTTFVYPASKSDGRGVTDVDLPEGSRLQLNPELTDADFDAWGLSAEAKVIARALQQYGMYTVDNSGSSKLFLEDRLTAGWGTSITRSLVSGIPWAQFRVIR